MDKDIAGALATFDETIASDSRPNAAWIALQILAQATIGAKLFTVMAMDMDKGLTRRAYTSDPLFPETTAKPIFYDEWLDTIYRQRKLFVANTIADLARVFPDSERIASIGCGSVINIPVFVGGKLCGTVNCLDAEQHYTPERVEMSKLLALPAKVAFLMEISVGSG